MLRIRSMEYDDLLLERLLRESASDTLVFRAGEYKFEGALNLEKSQLLRDVIGMANSWRRADSFILVGVEQSQSGNPKILGLIQHLDETKIVDFVNSKVQKPIAFHYRAYLYEQKKIGLIHIPLQERPFYLKEDYANLKKYVIYVKRGDSVLEANTEEVSKIKEFVLPEKKAEPVFRVEFANSKKKIPLGKHLTMKTFLIEVTGGDALPDLECAGTIPSEDGFSVFPNPAKLNRHYYRELADHFQKIGRVSMIDLCISNLGKEPVSGVFIEIFVEDPENQYFIQEAFEIPHRPEKDRGLSNLKPILQSWNAGVRARRDNRVWLIEIQFGEILPAKTVFSTHAIYVGARSSLSMDLHAVVHAKNMAQPIHVPLTIDIQTQKKVLDREVICK